MPLRFRTTTETVGHSASRGTGPIRRRVSCASSSRGILYFSLRISCRTLFREAAAVRPTLDFARTETDSKTWPKLLLETSRSYSVRAAASGRLSCLWGAAGSGSPRPGLDFHDRYCRTTLSKCPAASGVRG